MNIDTYTAIVKFQQLKTIKTIEKGASKNETKYTLFEESLYCLKIENIFIFQCKFYLYQKLYNK